MSDEPTKRDKLRKRILDLEMEIQRWRDLCRIQKKYRDAKQKLVDQFQSECNFHRQKLVEYTKTGKYLVEVSDELKEELKQCDEPEEKTHIDLPTSCVIGLPGNEDNPKW